MLPQLTSQDLGSPNEPGEYGCNGAMVSVDQHHVDVWRDQPGATFRTILLTRVGDRHLRLALGDKLAQD